MIKAEKYREFIILSLREIMAVDSPTGFSAAIDEKLLALLSDMGYAGEVTNKRLVKVCVPGRRKGKKLRFPPMSTHSARWCGAFPATENPLYPSGRACSAHV